MFTNSLCIPSAGIVPGSSGPPTWMNVPAKTNVPLDDPNWGGALQLSYGQVGIPNQSLTGEQATFRALYAGTDLFLSWLIRVDPDSLTDIPFDALHLGFSTGVAGSPQQQAAIIRVQITPTELNPVPNDNTFRVDTYLWNPTNKWGNPVTPLTQNQQFGWMIDGTHGIRVWTGQLFDNTPNLPAALQSINTVAWAIQMRIPIGTIIPANLNGGTNPAFAIGNSFSMWYSMVVKTPSSLQNNALVEYTWPEPSTPGNSDYYVKIDPNTLKENIFPDPASASAPWGQVTVGANAACSGGIAITPNNIGTENNPSSYIDPTLVPPNNTPFINVLYAEPLNRGAGVPSINAQDITARFRLANWGSQVLPNPPTNLNTNWTDIRGGEAVQGNNAQIPNNNTGGPATGHYINFSWALNASERAYYTFVDSANNIDQTHECLLVELSSPTKHYTFLNDSIVRNMDFHNPPLPILLWRMAEINVRGLEPIAPVGRDVFLRLQLANLPHIIGVGREEPLPVLNVEAFSHSINIPSLYVVQAYHDTGAKMLIEGKLYNILNAQTSFGYIIQHGGKTPIYGWDHRLEGAEVAGNNFYKVHVPNNGAVHIVTTVEPLKQPRGAKDSGFMVQSNIGTKGDFEVVVPHAQAGLVYCSRDNDANGYPWGNSTVLAQELGLVDGVTLIQSNLGNSGNLEIVARVKDKLFYLSGSDFNRTWSKPVEIAEGVAGNPALIQSRYGQRGNFELVVPLADGGIVHYWRNNDDPSLPWHRGDIFAKSLGNVDAVALIQSNFGQPQPGHLEVVARVGNELIHFWRDDGPIFKWRDNYPVKFYHGATGIPGFIQSKFGSKGNFEVVTPSVKGGMVHLWRNNDEPKTFPWKEGATFGEGNVTAVSLLQSNFTMSTNSNIPGPGDLEVAARVDRRTAHYWRRDLAPLNWSGPTAYACS